MKLSMHFELPDMRLSGCFRILALLSSLLALDVNAASIEERLKLQHHLDYQVPLTQATFIGTHNSYNAEDWGYGVGSLNLANQKRDPIDQLKAGFRVLNFDVHTVLYTNGSNQEVLCHFSGSSHLGCSGTEATFAFGLAALKQWLNENPGEVVLLVLEEYIDDHRFDDAVSTISAQVGSKVYRPNGGTNVQGENCFGLPVGKVTKQDVLDAGKQLIIVDGGSPGECSTTNNWETWVWHLNSNAFKADEYRTKEGGISRYPGRLSFLYEDRVVLASSDTELDGGEINDALVRGAAVIGMDMSLYFDRRENTVWSWAKNEPNNFNGDEDCAAQRSSGKWNDLNCSSINRFACQNKLNGSWSISDASGEWSEGQAACEALGEAYFFSVPVNASQNKALRLSAGTAQVWLNYSDRETEQVWVAEHFWNSPQISHPNPLQISLRSAHNTYATANSNGSMYATSTTNGAWEKFDLIYNDDGTYSLRGVHGYYASAKPSGALNADISSIGLNEKFYIYPVFGTNKIALSSVYGRFVVVEGGSYLGNLGNVVDLGSIGNLGNTPEFGDMNANRGSVGEWEQFMLNTHKAFSNLRWTFDFGLNEISSKANSAILRGSATYTKGPIDGALSFNGVDGYAEIPSSSNINFGRDDNFTVAAWVKVAHTQDTTKSDNAIIEKWDGIDGYPYVIRFLNRTNTSPGKILAARYDGSNFAKVVSTTGVDDERYHHIAFAKLGKTLKLYIDGKLNATATDSTTRDTTNSSPLYLGRRGDARVPIWFTGMVDDLRIYDHAITESELAEIMTKMEYRVEADVREQIKNVDLESDWPETPAVFANMQTYFGSDTADLRITAVDSDGFKVFVEEEQSRDTEVSHALEDIGFLAIKKGLITNHNGRAIGEVGTLTAKQIDRHSFTAVFTLHQYSQPIVIVSYNGRSNSEPSPIRLESVGPNSFMFRLDEWDYLDGVHPSETVSYMVVERGTHTLPNGVVIEAHKATVNDQWTGVYLQNTFTTPPVVLSQVQTRNEIDAVVTRMDNIANDFFYVRLQEQESLNDGHANETVGYIAVGR